MYRHLRFLSVALSLTMFGCGSSDNNVSPVPTGEPSAIAAPASDIGESSARAATVAPQTESRESAAAVAAPQQLDSPEVDPVVSSSESQHTNRLAQETSPYLRLHMHNPVNWYPWGPEALAKAKQENKMIFLSVGYSSCYWCHVMERESFMDEEIA